MVAINKLLLAASLLVSGFVSSPVGANTSVVADDTDAGIDSEASSGDTRKVAKKPIKMPKVKKEEGSEAPKSGLDKFISDLTDVDGLVKNLQTQEGQDKFVNNIMKSVNGMIGEAAGAATEKLESAVDEEISSNIGSILKGFGMGIPGSKGNSLFGGFDISKFIKPQ
jgi:hypothetical protein